MDHTAVDVCSNIKSSFEVFESFSTIRKQVVNIMDKDPKKMEDQLWTNSSPIPIDKSCFNKMGNKDNKCYSKGEKKFFSCSMCKIIGRLVDLTKHEYGKPFRIEVGEHEGDELIVKHNDLIVEVNGKSGSKVTVGKNKISTYLIATDIFTNDVLINWYLQGKLYNLPTILPMYAAFICNKNSYSLSRNITYDSLNSVPSEKFTKEVVKQILQQVVATFDAIDLDESYEFRYNIIDYSSLGFEFIGVTFEHDGIEYAHKVNMYFKDFDRSQILTKKGLFYNAPAILRIPLGKPNIAYKKVDIRGESQSVFSIRSGFLTEYLNDTHESFLLPKAVDFYFVISLLLSHGQFYTSFMKDEDLAIFWNGMWTPEQLSVVNSRMNIVRDAERDNITTHNLINVFDKIDLKENIIELSKFILSL